MDKTAIILFNLGGPDRLESVQPFLFNLFNDPAIIGAPQPIRWLIAKLISKRRAPIAQEIYRELGGGSPLLPNTVAQAAALENVLNAKNSDNVVKCFPVMRYWHPMADAVASEVRSWDPDRIVLLPLYPQFSTTTSGSSFKDWERAARRAQLSVPTTKVCCYPENPGFVSAVAERIKVALAETTGDGPLRILFSAHGLPKKVVDRGDPYKWAIEKTAAAVMTQIGESSLDWRVCYQSRVGPLEWIKPYTEDEIRQAGNEGTALIVVPIAFVSEHSETLVELDIEYRELAEESGVPGYRRVGTVSDDPSFIEGLCEIVLQAIARGPGLASETGTRGCPVSCGQCPVSG